MNKDIINYNSKGEWHGYNEWYWGGNLWFKRFYHNGIRIDYSELYYTNGGELDEKIFYI